MGQTPKLTVLRTEEAHFAAVVREQKHALDVRLDIQPGDILLLSKKGSGLVSYGMRFVRQRCDVNGETLAIWGRSWKFIVEGDGCCKLVRAFDPRTARITGADCKEYGRGGPFYYVLDEDAEAFNRKGLLRPLLSPAN